MRWSGRRESDNIEDRRGVSAKGIAGIGGVGVVIALIYALVTGDTGPLQQAGQGILTSPRLSAQQEEKYREFVAVTLADTEEVWSAIFKRNGRTYVPPKLVLFTGSVDSACGLASAAVGPFYCGEDQRAYVDLAFFDELESKLGAKGDFARAYVISHEIGHHVQNQLGILDRVHEKMATMGERERNRLSVRLELQADFYAGVWAHDAKQLAGLDRQDIEEALNAASQIGDDTLQKRTQGQVVPDAFTHGTSRQRMKWFMRGFETGDISKGDTFSARDL